MQGYNALPLPVCHARAFGFGCPVALKGTSHVGLCPADYKMIDKLNEIWQTLGALIARHPSVAIIFFLLGGIIQQWLDGREIRGLKAENKRLRADKDATESRLKLAQDEQSDSPSATIGSEDKYPSRFSPAKSDND